MRQYGLNMITNLLPDPDSIKQNNEVAKAQLKKRLVTDATPGPGDYNPFKQPPIGDSLSPNDQSLEFKKAKEKNLLSKLGLQDNLLGKKGLAFNSTAPRFQA